jgi:hypothetical protein
MFYFDAGSFMSKRLSIVHSLQLMAFAAFVASQVSAQNRSRKPVDVPMATYTDPAGDVSFDYPIVWKVDNSAKFYIAPHILQGQFSPLVQVIFSPVGNLYAKTNLGDLVFVYVKVRRQSEEACKVLAVGSVPVKPDTVLINGQPFQHIDTGDAGMCHGADQHIYWTHQGNTCYLFEGDMHTSCSGAVDGQRDLTKTETRALTRHLNAIPQSIRFAGPR